MKRFSVFLALMAIALVALTSAANAAVVIGQGDIHTATPPGSTVFGTTGLYVNVIDGSASLGHTFNNNIDTNTAFAGGTVRSVGSNLLTLYSFAGGGGTPVTYNTLQVALVFAVQGTTTAGGEPRFDATTGRVAFFQVPAGVSYNQFNPLTWGAVDAATGLVLQTPIAVWDLAPAQSVFDPGPNVQGGAGPSTFTLAPSQVNQISVNVAAPQAATGYFLFLESDTFVGPTLSGNEYWTTTSLPPGFDIGDGINEALITEVNETVNTNPLGNDVFQAAVSGGAGTPGFDALNTIASELGGLPWFATDFGPGAPSTFNPNPGPATSPDILTTLGTFSAAGVQFAPGEIPEPGAFLIWAVVGAACLGAHGWRRRRAVRQA